MDYVKDRRAENIELFGAVQSFEDKKMISVKIDVSEEFENKVSY